VANGKAYQGPRLPQDRQEAHEWRLLLQELLLLLPMYVARLITTTLEVALFGGPPPRVIDALTTPLLLARYVPTSH
jgi:hypothetical protein